MASLESAIEMGKTGHIEKWVHNFLNQPEPPGNNGLSKGLKLIKRYWTGPVNIYFKHMIQGCGPTEEFEFVENSVNWHKRIEENVQRLLNGETPPPLILEYKNNKLYISDGNHRFASLKQIGCESYWSIIWCSSEAEHKEFKKRFLG